MQREEHMQRSRYERKHGMYEELRVIQNGSRVRVGK